MSDSQDTVKPSDIQETRGDSGLLEPIVIAVGGYALLGLLATTPILFAEVVWGFTHKEFLHLWGEGPLVVVLVVTVIVTALGVASWAIPLLWKLHRLFTWVLVGCFVACAAIIGWQGTDSSHACFASSKHAELRAIGCSYVEEVIVADQVFTYTESYPLSKEVGGKIVNGTLYVVDAGYDGDRKYEHGEKVFIPKDDMKNSEYGGYSESQAWKNPLVYSVQTRDSLNGTSSTPPKQNWCAPSLTRNLTGKKKLSNDSVNQTKAQTMFTWATYSKTSGNTNCKVHT